MGKESIRVHHDRAVRVRPLAGKRTLVTGANGYLGRIVVERLREDGGELITVDWREPEDPIPGVTNHLADIRDPGRVREIFQHCRPEIVIHLAALAGPREAADTCDYMDVNFGGTLAVLEACRSVGGNVRVIVASSGHVYGHTRGLSRLRRFRRTSEKAPMRSSSPYGRSKRAAEELCELYRKLGLASTVVARLGNCFGGPGDPGVVGQLLRALEQGKPITVRRERRDFIHVDFLAGVFAAMAVSDVTGPVNVGSGESYSAEEILEMLLAARGPSAGQVDREVRPPAPGDAPDIWLSVRRLRGILERSTVPVPMGPQLREWIMDTVHPACAERPNGDVTPR
jgi:UDP-glucose 4-epimerase